MIENLYGYMPGTANGMNPTNIIPRSPASGSADAGCFFAQYNSNRFPNRSFLIDAVCSNKTKEDGNVWNDSYVRDWLNHTFINKTYTAEEKTRIVPGPTGDKVWLLSVNEAGRYFKNDKDRICKPTDHAKKNGLYTDSFGVSQWWLRSPGTEPHIVACVSWFGRIYSDCLQALNAGIERMVRPVIVVSLG